MRELTTEELKRVQLETLRDIDRFCRKERLHYSLSSGTLLGAIRHNGFIPWDDDIDILMPRPDFERFMRTYQAPASHAVCFDTDHKFPLTFGKVYDERTLLIERSARSYPGGVYIDVFQIDGLGSDLKQAQAHFNNIRRWRDILTIKSIALSRKRPLHRNVLLLALKAATLFFPYTWVQRKVICLMKHYHFENSKYAANMNFGDGHRVRDIKIFSEYTTHIFEGEEFCILTHYDAYLTSIFGDYMKLPPVEQRVTHHAFKAYWKE